MAFRRHSKFRHVFGKALKRDQCYDALRISKSSWDSTFCAVNSKFVAVIAETSGGGFVVLPLSKVGRIDIDQPLVCGHTRPILDIAWCPHDDNMIASGGEDCTVKVWQIPDGGLKEPLTEPAIDLNWHEKRVTTVLWHPTAQHVLLSSGSDYKIVLWNLQAGTAGLEIGMPDQLYSLAFSDDGSLIACTCKDKKLRILDSHTGDIKGEIHSHDGSKPQQCVFVKDNKVITTGFSRMSERQYALWELKGSEIKNVAKEEIDNSNGVLFIFNDIDTGMFYLAGKGDSLIRYYEVLDDAPFVQFLNLYQSNAPQRGIGYMPKRGLNVNQNEIARFYKLHNNGLCEVIPFTVPRKSELFQDDLYPDTASDQPAMTSDEFFAGKNAKPILVSLKEGSTATKKDHMSVVRKSNVFDKTPSKVPPQTQSNIQSSNNAAEAAAAPTLPPVHEGGKDYNESDVEALLKEIENLKKTVQNQDSRIQKLEEKVTTLEALNAEGNNADDDKAEGDNAEDDNAEGDNAEGDNAADEVA